MTEEALMSLEAFASRLCASLKLEVAMDELSRDTSLFEDLALDSFQAFEMIVVIEELADLLAPLPDLPAMYTLGDAYEYYRLASAASREYWDPSS